MSRLIFALEKLDMIRGKMKVINLLQDEIDDLIAKHKLNNEPFHLESLMLWQNLDQLTAELENLDEELRSAHERNHDEDEIEINQYLQQFLKN